jgi:prevent-host-death family protein
MLAEKETATSVWQLQTAKAQFSQVVKRATESGPQLVTKAGIPAVYVVSAELFETQLSKDVKDRKQILQSSPHHDTRLDLERERHEGREVEL